MFWAKSLNNYGVFQNYYIKNQFKSFNNPYIIYAKY